MRGARRYEDLIVWQLADHMRILVFALTAREHFARDLKLHSQTEDAVNSVCRNIAEGFGCRHMEFARFLEISRRSLNELRDCFRTAQLKGYCTARDYEPIWRLAHRLYPAYAEFIHYLRTTPDPDPVTPRRQRQADPKPARTGRNRARTNPHPTCTDPQRASTDPQPTCTNEQPTSTDPNPIRTNPQPTSTDPHPTCTNQQPTSTDPQPTCTNQQPISTDPQPTRHRR